MSLPEDERASARFEKDCTIFVELESASENNPESKIVICNSLDLSAGGLQLVLDRSIPKGNILRLCLDIKGRDLIFVVAQVMWLKRNDETKDFNFGLMLLNSEGTDFDHWQLAISEIFPAQAE